MQNRTSISRAAQARRIDMAPRPPAGAITGPPHRFDIRALLRVGEPAPAGQQLRMHAGLQGPAVVRAAGDVREPSPGPGGERPCGVHRARPVRQARSRDDQAGVARLGERTGEAGAVLEGRELTTGRDEDVLGHIEQAGAPRMQHHDAGPPLCGPSQPQVQDRHLLLGVEAGDEDHLRALDVPVRHARRRGPRPRTRRRRRRSSRR
jgi:hypothetical protein